MSSRRLTSPSRSASFEDLLGSLPLGLTQTQVTDAFDRIISGEVPDVQIAAFLFGLRVKGESTDEVQGIADSLLRASPTLSIPGPLLDIVGTGGDRTDAISISTPASVLASAVTPHATVVKHGNRGATTKTGSADVIEAWGVPLDLTPPQVAHVGREAGITFCFAPRFHAAMQYTAPARRALNVPTVMNILGPLINPASPRYQLVGVADPARIDLIAQVLNARGTFALVARGRDGLDKLTVTGPTDVTLVAEGRTSTFQVSPEDVGLTRSSLDSLLGSTPQENASRLVGVLSGSEQGPRRGASQRRSRVRAGRGQVRPLHRAARGEDERLPGRHRSRFGDGKAEVLGDGGLSFRNHSTGPGHDVVIDRGPSRRMLLVGAACAATAAAVWAAVALHQLSAHGRTEVNEMRVVAGLTWMDSAKALPLALLLLIPGLTCLIHRAEADDARGAAMLGRVVLVLVVVSAVTGTVDFWSFPLGSYAVTFESLGDAFPWQFLTSVVAGLLMVALAVMRRTGAHGEWAVLALLGIGMMAGSVWTPAWLWPSFAWAGFAAWLGWVARRHRLLRAAATAGCRGSARRPRRGWSR